MSVNDPDQLRLALRRRPVLRTSCIREVGRCIRERACRVPVGESLCAILEGCCAHNASQHCSVLLRSCGGALLELCAALKQAPLPRLPQLALLHALLLGVETVDAGACQSGEATNLVLALLHACVDSRLAGEAEAELGADLQRSLMASGGGPDWLIDSGARASLVSTVERALHAPTSATAAPAASCGDTLLQGNADLWADASISASVRRRVVRAAMHAGAAAEELELAAELVAELAAEGSARSRAEASAAEDEPQHSVAELLWELCSGGGGGGGGGQACLACAARAMEVEAAVTPQLGGTCLVRAGAWLLRVAAGAAAPGPLQGEARRWAAREQAGCSAEQCVRLLVGRLVLEADQLPPACAPCRAPCRAPPRGAAMEAAVAAQCAAGNFTPTEDGMATAHAHAAAAPEAAAAAVEVWLSGLLEAVALLRESAEAAPLLALRFRLLPCSRAAGGGACAGGLAGRAWQDGGHAVIDTAMRAAQRGNVASQALAVLAACLGGGSSRLSPPVARYTELLLERHLRSTQPLTAPAEAETAPAEAAPPPAAPAPEVPCPSFTTDELEALKAGCAFAEFGPTHELALAYMRWRRDEALAAGGGGEPLSAEFAADIRLVRFLAACGWDAMAAADMYVEALQWRTEQRMDAVREQLVRANAAFFVHGGEALSEVVATAHDAAVQAVQPRTFTRLLPGGGGHAPLLDRQGNLVCIECPGLVDNAGIAALGTAAWARSYLCGVELGVLIIDELSRRQGRLVRTCHREPPGPTAHGLTSSLTNPLTRLQVLMFRCFDMTGFKMIKAFQSREEKEGERAFKEASGIASKVYPTTTFKNFFFNLPAAGAAGPIVKAMAPARSAKKFVLLGSKYQDELSAYIEPSQLPRRLGGVLDDGVQWGGEKKKKK